MSDRLQRELELLQGRYPDTVFREEGHWVFFPKYPVVKGVWARDEYAICFQIRAGYPDISPYGINMSPPARGPKEEVPKDYVDAPEPKPPFEGEWGRFSWEMPEWKPTPDIVSGSTLLNYVESIRKRFEEGYER